LGLVSTRVPIGGGVAHSSRGTQASSSAPGAARARRIAAELHTHISIHHPPLCRWPLGDMPTAQRQCNLPFVATDCRTDWAHPAHICTGTGAHPAHICTGTGAHPAHICTGTGAHPAHICTGTGAHPCPRLCRDWDSRLPHLHRDWGSPLPHLHQDWAQPCHICTRTGLSPATSAPGPYHICTGTGRAIRHSSHGGLCTRRRRSARSSARARPCRSRWTTCSRFSTVPSRAHATERRAQMRIRTRTRSHPRAPGAARSACTGTGQPRPHLHRDRARPLLQCRRPPRRCGATRTSLPCTTARRSCRRRSRHSPDPYCDVHRASAARAAQTPGRCSKRRDRGRYNSHRGRLLQTTAAWRHNTQRRSLR
jgi:hypothetical protein